MQVIGHIAAGADEDAVAVDQEGGGIGGRVLARLRRHPGHRFALGDLDGDFVGQDALHFRAVHLRQRHQVLARGGEIDRENIRALADAGRGQDLLAAERAVRVDGDLREIVIRVLPEAAPQRLAPAIADAADGAHDQDDRAEPGQHLAIALRGGFARAHLHIQQKLLLALLARGDALVAAGLAGLAYHRAFSSGARASESWMMRSHSSP